MTHLFGRWLLLQLTFVPCFVKEIRDRRLALMDGKSGVLRISPTMLFSLFLIFIIIRSLTRVFLETSPIRTSPIFTNMVFGRTCETGEASLSRIFWQTRL